MSLILDEHREYLSDRVRVDAFRKALRESLKPGDVVVDLGAGTGILGMLACQAGAGRVYSIDEGAIVGLVRDVVRANGLDDRVTVLRGTSTRVALAEPADVVVADQIGRFGFEAGILDCFADAGRRFLKPDGRAIPSRIDLWIALVQESETWKHLQFWDRRPAGFSFEPAAAIARNTGYPVEFSRKNLLGGPLKVASLDTLTHGSTRVAFTASMEVERAGTMHGIGGWFVAQLSPGITMTNSPLASRRIHRRNVLFPIGRAVNVSRGDRVDVGFVILPHQVVVSWTVSISSNSKQGGRGRLKARFAHSTVNGMLISREDLSRTDPDGVPVLSRWGEARQTVLELCDGTRTLREVEAGVLRRHHDLFSTADDAAVFAAEVITRYAR